MPNEDEFTGASEPGHIPLAPEAATPAQVPPARASEREKPALIDLEDDTCPKCHAPLAKDAVVCVNCGYDLRENVVRAPEVGVVEIDGTARGKPARPEFVRPGRGSPQVLATTGVFLTLAALILAGVFAPRLGAMFVTGRVALTLYEILLHTCTGVAAVIAAARLTEERFTRLELAAARMFVAVGLFYAIRSLDIPIRTLGIGEVLKWAAALGAYFLAVWFLFKRDRYGASLIALSHFVMWVLLQIGAALAGWVAGTAAAAARGG